MLEMFVRLGEVQENRGVLVEVIDGQLQMFMVNHYMHDGLLSTLVLKLL